MRCLPQGCFPERGTLLNDVTRTEYFGGDAASVILRIFFCRRQKVRRINAAAA